MHAFVFWGIGISALITAIGVIAYAATREERDPRTINPLDLPANTFSDTPAHYVGCIIAMIWFAGMFIFGVTLPPGFDDLQGGAVWGGVIGFVGVAMALMYHRNNISSRYGNPPSAGHRAHYEEWLRSRGRF